MHSNAANTQRFSYAALFGRGGLLARYMVKLLMAVLMIFGMTAQASAQVAPQSPAKSIPTPNVLDSVAPILPIYWRATSYYSKDTQFKHASLNQACNAYSVPPEYIEITLVRYNQSGGLQEFRCIQRIDIASQVYSYMDCPVPTVYTYSPYNFNWDKAVCERFIPATILTLTLSGDSTTEPWHKKRDKEHTRANLPYQAIVRDQNGQPKANVSVTIDTDVTSDSGGHIHINGRPKGKLVATTAGTVSTKNGTDTITGITDGSGVFAFTFGAEEASGSHTLTANCTDCKAPANSTINVAIQGLMLLDADPLSYELRGERDTHINNHYFSPAALVKIINLAHQYHLDPDFNGKLLKINDSSLIKGGTFDVQLDWTSLSNVHGGHRVGIVVDINNYQASSKLFEELASECCGITAKFHARGTAPHYHLWLLGEDR